MDDTLHPGSEGRHASAPTTDGVHLTPDQVTALRRELEVALQRLESLDHLCSIQALGGGAEEAITAALYILNAAQSNGRERP